MNLPIPENQNFSEKTLKGFLLKNIELNSKNQTIQELNKFLIERVDEFWDQIVVPLQEQRAFDGNKINWYFEIYKEGLDARRLGDHPFTFVEIKQDQVQELVNFYKDKTLKQYIMLGTSFLSNSYTMLSSWIRDQMVLLRLKEIYSSSLPVDWIKRAEEEEHGVMDQKPDQIKGLTDVLMNIQLIISRQV